MLRFKPKHGRHGRPNWDLRVGWFAVIVSLFVWAIVIVLVAVVLGALSGGGLHPSAPPPR